MNPYSRVSMELGLKTVLRVVPVRPKAKVPLWPFSEHQRWAAEQYRIIRTKLLQHPQQPRIVVISSPGPGDGKTLSAVNIAGSLALKGDADVLLMDVDFRRRSLDPLLGVPSTPGLADLLVGRCTAADAVVRLEPFQNLYFLPAGEDGGKPVELLDSPRWKETCDALRQQFDYVVLDAPPVGVVADYDLIQTVCDGAILVVRPDHTNRGACLKALQSVTSDRLLGVVMNCVEDSLVGRSYGHYYGSYY